MELSKSQLHIVQPHHGTHVIGVQLIQLEKVLTVSAIKDMLWLITLVFNVNLHKLLLMDNVNVQFPDKHLPTEFAHAQIMKLLSMVNVQLAHLVKLYKMDNVSVNNKDKFTSTDNVNVQMVKLQLTVLAQLVNHHKLLLTEFANAQLKDKLQSMDNANAQTIKFQ